MDGFYNVSNQHHISVFRAYTCADTVHLVFYSSNMGVSVYTFDVGAFR